MNASTSSPARCRRPGRGPGGIYSRRFPAHADRIEKHFAVQAKPKITVRNSNGRIQVKAWTKNEVLVAWTNASGKSAVETEEAGNRVEVATQANEDGAIRRTIARPISRSLFPSRANSTCEPTPAT